MRVMTPFAILVALVLALAPAVSAQSTGDGVMADLIRDLDEVQTKIVGLAKVMPATAFEWRPGEGVRSTSETLMHIAADNYFLPAMLGTPAPAETGVNEKYDSAVAFEKRKVTRDQALSELEKSFAFLKKSMTSFPEARMGESRDFFGRKATNRSMWIGTMTHLHEHLGQLIAYARSNKVVPPWSK
jgi:hypothetical protein